jgi:zinc protease
MNPGRIAATALLVLLQSMYAAGAALAQTTERVLANGMKVLVIEDHRAPTVAHMVWYRAGSIDEVNGGTGVAHVLEHMMFKGTRDLPAGRVLPPCCRDGRPRERIHLA